MKNKVTKKVFDKVQHRYTDSLIKTIQDFQSNGNVTHYAVFRGEVIGFPSKKIAEDWFKEYYEGDSSVFIKEVPTDENALIILNQIELEKKLNSILHWSQGSVGMEFYSVYGEYLFSKYMNIVPKELSTIDIEASHELWETGLLDLTEEDWLEAIENEIFFSFHVFSVKLMFSICEEGTPLAYKIVIAEYCQEDEGIPINICLN